MAQVELAGDTWIYPLLEDLPTTATFDITVTLDTTQDLHVGPGTITIGSNTYTLNFTEGDLRVDTSDTSDPFDAFHDVSVQFTRVVAATLLNADKSTFATGDGAFSWSKDVATFGESPSITVSTFLDLRLIDSGQLYNVRISDGDPPGTSGTPQTSSFRAAIQSHQRVSPFGFRFQRSLKTR